MSGAPQQPPRAHPARGFPWLDHLTLADVDECAELERRFWRREASWSEQERLRQLRSKRLRAGVSLDQPHYDEAANG